MEIYTLDSFLPDFYLQKYPDIALHYGSGNHEGAQQHFRDHGAAEGRSPNPYFDPRYYLNQYEDLRNEFTPNGYMGALNHWIEYGIHEGRKGSQNFDPVFYINKYADLKQTFGATGYRRAFEHWLVHGPTENRVPSKEYEDAMAGLRTDVIRHDLDGNIILVHNELLIYPIINPVTVRWIFIAIRLLMHKGDEANETPDHRPDDPPEKEDEDDERSGGGGGPGRVQ